MTKNSKLAYRIVDALIKRQSHALRGYERDPDRGLDNLRRRWHKIVKAELEKTDEKM